MTVAITKEAEAASVPGYVRNLRRICVATNWSALAQRFRSELAPAEVVIQPSLADLMIQTDCDLYIVDTKVPDMRLWPAPLLSATTANRPWLFLVANAGDLGQLSRFPANCRVFERRAEALDRLFSYLRTRSDPASSKRLAGVDYLSRMRTFLVRFDNSNAYMLPLSDLPQADKSPVTRTRIGRGRHHFTVVQESGNSFEVPWDDVLYHCEPSYPYHKGRSSIEQNQDRARRIGARVRAAREREGLTVSELAMRAGMKRPNVSRLEHGHHEPSLDTLERIAEALDTPVAQLVASK